MNHSCYLCLCWVRVCVLTICSHLTYKDLLSAIYIFVKFFFFYSSYLPVQGNKVLSFEGHKLEWFHIVIFPKADLVVRLYLPEFK